MIHAFPARASMWFVMMTLMMVPTVAPWLLAVRRLGGSAPLFAAGFAAAWLVYSLAAATVQGFLPHQLPAAATAAIFLIAGAFQFAPWKLACLTHCRNPLTFLLTRWRTTMPGVFRIGLDHGLFCVGCCWALMAIALVVGMADWAWMAALAAITFVEQVWRRGDLLRVSVGVALIARGLVTFY